MGTLKQVVVDCRHPARLARFWADALDGFEVLAYDDAEIARLAELGLTPDTDPCVIVIGPGLELGFQQVDVEDAAKKPLHLDLSAASRKSEVHRLVRLGATVK
ncbi:MAG TPA: VOC family protein, partial [Acidimicrobiia bacterium]|nr:VOC family protein [Acidimicrobiia bacterium]